MYTSLWSKRIFFSRIHIEVGVCYPIQMDRWSGSLTYELILIVFVLFSFFCLFELRLNNCCTSLLLSLSVWAHTDFVIRKCTRPSISQVENNDWPLERTFTREKGGATDHLNSSRLIGIKSVFDRSLGRVVFDKHTQSSSSIFIFSLLIVHGSMQ